MMMTPRMSSTAPLASMEDISQAGTPLPTPGPSPRTRNRWSHRSSLGIILDEEEEDDKNDVELEDHQTSIDGETDPLLFSNKPHVKTNSLIPTDVTGDQKLRPNGRSSPHKLVSLPCQYAARDTKYPSQCAKLGKNTKEVVEMQFLTPRRNFRKRSELHPVYEYFEIEEAERHRNPSHDSYHFVFLVCVFQGLAVSLPFSLVTVSHKFHQGIFSACDDTSPAYPTSPTSWLQSLPNFLLVSLVLQVISAAPASAFPVRWFSTRVGASLGALVISILMLVISFLTNLSQYLVIPCIVIHSIFTGLYFTTICGMVARLPVRHISAIFLGMGLSGVMAALMELLQIFLNPSSRVVIIYYLIIMLAIYLIAFDLHFALPLNSYYQHHHPALPPPPHSSAPTTQYRVFILLYVTTSLSGMVSPTVLQDTAPLSEVFPHPDYFNLLLCYLNYYLFTCLGVISATFSHLPCLWLAVLLTMTRLLLLPLFLISNYLPDTRVLVVVVQWDWTFALNVTIFAFLGGFVIQLLIVSILRGGNSTEARSVLAMRGCAVILIGRLTGTALSFLLPAVVNWQL